MVEKKEIVGDCLEGIGIPSRGYADIDLDAIPHVFDVVWCSGVFGGEVGGFLKEVVKTGERPVVSTRYKNGTKDYGFLPADIYGVVLRIRDPDGNVVWERPPDPAESRELNSGKEDPYMERDTENIFRHHKPTQDQRNRFDAIRDKAKELDLLIERACPVSRERDMAHARLEEATMWANASIDRNGGEKHG